MTGLNTLEREFINRFQGGFPLTGRPFSQVAESLRTREAVLIHTVESLLRKGLLSRFGPLIDAERLGGEITLAAMEVSARHYERVATQVNVLAGVAHNYRRDHRLNMWFVVAGERPGAIAATLAEIERCTGLRVYNFPRQRAFYLGLWLHLDDDGQIDTVAAPAIDGQQGEWQADAFDRRLLAATQAGLPLCADPWAELAQRLDSNPALVLDRLRKMLAAGAIRRIGAVPNHYRLGLRGNGMSVWDVPDDMAASLGERIGQLDCVSHCYLRPRHAGVWPYNLFAMLHGRDRERVRDKARQIEHLLGRHCRGHDILFSSAVLKKTGLRLAA
ncbi:MAG: Lrp/AsnC family transcriptional regulator [Gammaproteobacteria bacterium]